MINKDDHIHYPFRNDHRLFLVYEPTANLEFIRNWNPNTTLSYKQSNYLFMFVLKIVKMFEYICLIELPWLNEGLLCLP